MTWIERAKKVTPYGAMTRSKGFMQFGEGVYPVAASSGNGCILSTDKGDFVDWISSLGTIIHGYNHVKLYEAWDEGPGFSLPSKREVELAEELIYRLPFTSKWMFLSDGMDATTGAIKLARAYTGIMPFASIGYHGHDPIFSCNLPLNGGTNPKLKEDIVEYKFEQLEQLCSDLEEVEDPNICAVIIEYPPIEKNNWNTIKQLSHKLQAACNRKGVVLIMDEVLSFLRARNWCLSNELDIQPDIVCLGKALGNGYPISAIGSKDSIMDLLGPKGNVFISNTFNGFPISLAASVACLKFYGDNGVYNKIYSFGQTMMNTLNDLGKPHNFHVEGDPFRFKWKGSNPTLEKILAQQLVKVGHLTMPSGYFLPNYAHTKLNDTWVGDFRKAIEKTQTAKLEGKESTPVLLQNR